MKKTRKCPCCLGTGQEQQAQKVGAEMRERRLTAGLKLSWVSKKMGISISHLSYLEQGKRQWNTDLADRFLKAVRS